MINSYQTKNKKNNRKINYLKPFEFKKGNIPHNKGKTFVHKGSFKKGGHPTLGKHWKISKPRKPISEETRMKLRNHRNKQVFPIKDTKIEIIIQEFLNTLGIIFERHKQMAIQHSYQCDIFIPSLNIVIECDGDYWHDYPNGTEIDKIRTNELRKVGYKVLRLWEHDIYNMSIEHFYDLLNRVE